MITITTIENKCFFGLIVRVKIAELLRMDRIDGTSKATELVKDESDNIAHKTRRSLSS